MAFPEASRVLYESNPLEEVICQIRFTPILKIDTEIPAEFQDKVRGDYPLYEAKSAVRIPSNLPPDLSQMVTAGLPFGGQKIHEFSCKDRIWTANLARDYLSLTCHKYDRWENFKMRLHGPLEALTNHYKPPIFIRLGLRYRDVIRRSRLKLTEVPWSELLDPWVTGPLGRPETLNEVEFIQSTCVLHLADKIGRVQIGYGLATDASNNETVFLIDADFFTEEQTEPSNVFERLDSLNRQAGFFFRWCITDRLHQAMGPNPIHGG